KVMSINYAILANPGHNRVYFDSSRDLVLAELSLICSKLDTICTQIESKTIGGILYYTFKAENHVNEKDIISLSALSCTYAIFTYTEDEDGIKLSPVNKKFSRELFCDGISSMLKYTGKTNELFTRLMINAAIACAAFKDNE